MESKGPVRILTAFGTRPEVVKLAPLLTRFNELPGHFESVVLTTAQHRHLQQPFIDLFKIHVDHDLDVMRSGQPLNRLAGQILSGIDPVLEAEEPEFVVVQGDTTTALTAALAAFHRRIPVVHVEAGLRTEDLFSPFPEEGNRRLITRIASHHMAATERNVEFLKREGVAASSIHLTGNPVVDALYHVLAHASPSEKLREVMEWAGDRRLIVLTTHRRESFGPMMAENMRVLRDFVAERPGFALVFPVHPNPVVRGTAETIFKDQENVLLIDPLHYPDFIQLLSRAWLIASDSGGVQEEAPSLGKPVLVLRSNTERPEAVDCGVAKLIGNCPQRLSETLAHLAVDESWLRTVRSVPNPFGDGRSAERIAAVLWRAARGTELTGQRDIPLPSDNNIMVAGNG